MNHKPSSDDFNGILQSLVQQPETVQFDPATAQRRAVNWRCRKQQAKRRLAGFVSTGVAMLIGASFLWPVTGSKSRSPATELVQTQSPSESNAQPADRGFVESEQVRIDRQLASLDQMRREIAELRRETQQLQQIRQQQRFWIVREQLTRGEILAPTKLEL